MIRAVDALTTATSLVRLMPSIARLPLRHHVSLATAFGILKRVPPVLLRVRSIFTIFSGFFHVTTYPMPTQPVSVPRSARSRIYPGSHGERSQRGDAHMEFLFQHQSKKSIPPLMVVAVKQTCRRPKSLYTARHLFKGCCDLKVYFRRILLLCRSLE